MEKILESIKALCKELIDKKYAHTASVEVGEVYNAQGASFVECLVVISPIFDDDEFLKTYRLIDCHIKKVGEWERLVNLFECVGCTPELIDIIKAYIRTMKR